MSTRVADLPIPKVSSDEVTACKEIEKDIEIVNLHRDERDVRVLLRVTGTGFVLSMLLLSSLAMNAWQYYRRPDRIIVDRRADGDHVVTVNGRDVGGGSTNGIIAGPDKPGIEDKRRIANEWAMARYGVDPQGREQTVETFLKMMTPQAATKYVSLMKQRGELERERGERVQSVWKPELTVVDSTNPLRVNITGTQEIDKVVGGIPIHESVRRMFSLKLMPDRESGRAAHNLYTGFLVLDILDPREVVEKSANESDSVLTQQTQKK